MKQTSSGPRVIGPTFREIQPSGMFMSHGASDAEGLPWVQSRTDGPAYISPNGSENYCVFGELMISITSIGDIFYWIDKKPIEL